MFMPSICPVDPWGAALVRAEVRMLWIRLIEQVRGRRSKRKSSKPRTIVCKRAKAMIKCKKLFESFKMSTHMIGPNHGHKIPLLLLKVYPG